MFLRAHVFREIASALNVDAQVVQENLRYQSIPQWDSLAHFNLMIHLENNFSVRISNQEAARLSTPQEIYEFLNGQIFSAKSSEQEIHRGLVGITFDKTNVSWIDADGGQVYYRGYPISQLVVNHSYEQVAFLLLFGRIPQGTELDIWDQELKKYRSLSPEHLQLASLLKNHHSSEALSCFFAFLAAPSGAWVADPDQRRANFLDSAIQAIALTPTFIAAQYRLKNGLQPVAPHDDLSHAANFLYMLKGEVPTAKQAHLLDRDLILHAEHGSNASAFAGRVAASTQNSFFASVSAAMSTFAGRIHGGAIEEVLKMFDEIKSVKQVEPYISRRMATKLGVPGFGHRVYRVEDPRAMHLLNILEELRTDETCEKSVDFDVMNEVKRVMERYRTKGMEINVDFYAGLSYRLLGLADELSVPLFFMSRIAGVSAHILEQTESNILIRPLLKYSGEVRSIPSSINGGCLVQNL